VTFPQQTGLNKPDREPIPENRSFSGWRQARRSARSATLFRALCEEPGLKAAEMRPSGF
jgi:hypothetical protein